MKPPRSFPQSLGRLIAFSIPAALVLTVAAPRVLAQDVGDYGDAPDGTDAHYPDPFSTGPVIAQFPTLYSSNGARHLNTNQEWLGPDTSSGPRPPVSDETNADDPADPDPNFTGSPGVPNLLSGLQIPNNDLYDDAFGTTFPFFLVLDRLPPAATVNFALTVAPGAPDVPRYVNVLVDWDMNGRWQNSTAPDTAPEWAVQNFFVTQTPGTTRYYSVPIGWGMNAKLSPQVFWMRMTLSRRQVDAAAYGTAGWDGTGRFDFGETEDHLINPGCERSWDGSGPNWTPPSKNPQPEGPWGNIELEPEEQEISHKKTTYIYILLKSGDFPNADIDWTLPAGQRGSGTGLLPEQKFADDPNMPPPGLGNFYKEDPSKSTGTEYQWLAGNALPTNAPSDAIAAIRVKPTLNDYQFNPEIVTVKVKAYWKGTTGFNRTDGEVATIKIFHSTGSQAKKKAAKRRLAALKKKIKDLEKRAREKEELEKKRQQAEDAWEQGGAGGSWGPVTDFLLELSGMLNQGGLTADEEEAEEHVQELLAALAIMDYGPVCWFTAPDSFATVHGTVPVTVETEWPGATGVMLEYGVDDGAGGIAWSTLGAMAGGPETWTFDWNTTAGSDGPGVLRAIIDDGASTGEDTLDVHVDNIPLPSLGPCMVNLLAPEDTRLQWEAPDGLGLVNVDYLIRPPSGSGDWVEVGNTPLDPAHSGPVGGEISLDCRAYKAGDYEFMVQVRDEDDRLIDSTPVTFGPVGGMMSSLRVECTEPQPIECEVGASSPFTVRLFNDSPDHHLAWTLPTNEEVYPYSSYGPDSGLLEPGTWVDVPFSFVPGFHHAAPSGNYGDAEPVIRTLGFCSDLAQLEMQGLAGIDPTYWPTITGPPYNMSPDDPAAQPDADADGDGNNNYYEIQTGANPLDFASRVSLDAVNWNPLAGTVTIRAIWRNCLPSPLGTYAVYGTQDSIDRWSVIQPIPYPEIIGDMYEFDVPVGDADVELFQLYYQP